MIMTAAATTRVCPAAVINEIAIVVADMRRHSITTTREVLRDESDDYEQRHQPMHNGIPVRGIDDYRPLVNPVNCESAIPESGWPHESDTVIAEGRAR